ncbi:MAG: tRNA (guanosine(37)-N1)-methyltransferase TrmD [Candidatus Melainabacteria bacterium RIFCSPLOWO2_02_FULL_35_15]|nr:MAG: tRNA (guanosine(37)-N1)-methyltransferase TrmD [Candidatus Melainabacteria bacterium RIFCSPLOWO2_12_FULL_35_11]OGI14247.1 MAG: tRNA (guanosine(37)-N1)-methyltransferase TrmD [Candidatus Melainabacteria bacterium RIFCSPLOWO2_02_FULL_35_15]
MQFDVITLFPDFIKSYCQFGIIGRAYKEEKIKLNTVDLRQFGLGKHKQVDDLSYGGGVGLILMVEPLFNALKKIPKKEKSKILITSASGKKWDQDFANKLKNEEQIIIICGRYEGYDERVLNIIDHEICLGDFILTGGELCALAVIDSVSRLVQGVLRKEETLEEESFKGGCLEYPQYTRPNEFNSWKVPDILLSGHHAEIKKWREEQAKEKTRKNRPDLVK